MRRKEKQITDHDILTGILQQSHVAHLAMAENNQPYCIPVNFAYHNEKIYIHCAVEGKNPCNSGMKYASVNCFGKASIIDSFEEKDSILGIITRKYMKGDSFSFSREKIHATRCICINIETISGKSSGYTIPKLLKKLNLQ